MVSKNEMKLEKTQEVSPDSKTKPVSKKKKTRFFETYISKVLKQISENGITSNSKQQLNSAICIIATELSSTIIHLTTLANKKTISVKEISNAIKLLFTGKLLDETIKEGEKSIETFTEKNSKGTSRQGKAGIVFPPSVAEKFLRNFGNSKVMVTNSAPVYFAAVLEYVVAETLILASESAKTHKRIRITIRDLQLSVEKDVELRSLFKKLNISFLGGGVTPFIHPSLKPKKVRRKKKTQVATTTPATKKGHRFRPGTVALREIKKYQKLSNCLTFAKFPFERLVRSVVSQFNDSMKISKDVFIILQYYIEQAVVDFLKKANSAAIHCGRVKLMLCDIQFISMLENFSDVSDLVANDQTDSKTEEGEGDEEEADDAEDDDDEEDEEDEEEN